MLASCSRLSLLLRNIRPSCHSRLLRLPPISEKQMVGMKMSEMDINVNIPPQICHISLMTHGANLDPAKYDDQKSNKQHLGDEAKPHLCHHVRSQASVNIGLVSIASFPAPFRYICSYKFPRFVFRRCWTGIYVLSSLGHTTVNRPI